MMVIPFSVELICSPDGAVVLQGIANTLQVGDDLVSEWVATLWLIEPDGQPALVEFAFDRIGMG